MDNPAYTPSPYPPPPPQKSGPPKVLFIAGVIFACAFVACGGCLAIGAWAQYSDQQNYGKGHAAYLAGNCADAIKFYDQLTGDDSKAKAKPEQDQFAKFQSAREQ